MAYEETEIGKLVKSDPKRAAEKLVELFQRAGGNSVHAALLAGVHHATMKRWVIRLDLRKHLDKARASGASRAMSGEQRGKLLEKTREKRRVSGLQRMYDRLGPEERTRLAEAAGVKQRVLEEWRRDRGSVKPSALAAVDAAVGRLQARFRSKLREVNRGKHAEE